MLSNVTDFKGLITSKIFHALLFKANHLAYIEPKWYGSRIYANCQQKLLFTRHDTSGRFLLVTFLEMQKREDGTQRYCSFFT